LANRKFTFELKPAG